MISSTPDVECVARPRLVLRIGLAGSMRVPASAESDLSASLTRIFSVTLKHLRDIGSDARSGILPRTRVTHYFSPEPACLRLVTGLAEGVDVLGVHSLNAATKDTALTGHVESDLVAVLPFDTDTYRTSRVPAFRNEFDRLLAICSYVVTVDGCFDSPHPDTPLAELRRARAYRGQARILLRQSDILIAVLTDGESGKPGGTIETVRAAVTLRIPVVVVRIKGTEVRIDFIEPGNEFEWSAAPPAADTRQWEIFLSRWVDRLVAAPDTDAEGAGPIPELQMLEEYFFDDRRPPATVYHGSKCHERRRSIRECLWGGFLAHFRKGTVRRASSNDVSTSPNTPATLPTSNVPPSPLSAYRDRARSLNYHYAGLYRGAFLANYVLAVVAVSLSALSLVVLALDLHDAAKLLLALGAVELAVVVFIFWNTKQANSNDWNGRAVSYRYLAERLRSLYFLTCCGSTRAPSAQIRHPLHRARALRQSAADWLYQAIERSSSPAAMFPRIAPSLPDNVGSVPRADSISLHGASTMAVLRDKWIADQGAYHRSNERVMHLMYHRTERWVTTLNLTVIVILAADLLASIAKSLGRLSPALVNAIHDHLPFLFFFTAVIPAVVAGVNGIRFQSECQKLSERSAAMRSLLTGHSGQDGGLWAEANRLHDQLRAAADDPLTNPGALCVDALLFAEDVVLVMAQEVSEWSVLYAKEIPET